MAGSSTAEQEAIQEEVFQGEVGLEAMYGRFASRFTRAEAQRRALAYLKGLLGLLGGRRQGKTSVASCRSDPMALLVVICQMFLAHGIASKQHPVA